MNLIDFHMHPYLTGSQYTGMYLEPGPESGKNVMDKIRCDIVFPVSEAILCGKV